MTEHVQVSTENGVMRMTLNRPEKKNALTRAMYAAMTDALEQAAREEQVRVVVLTGSGAATAPATTSPIFGKQHPRTERLAPRDPATAWFVLASR